MRDKILGELSKIEREGIQQLIEFLDESDFYTSPCSTKYHLNREGGLAEHSWGVFCNLKHKIEFFGLDVTMDTVRICGLLHDICKVESYFLDKGKYKFKSEFPLDHGVKSIYLIGKYLDLTEEEILAIRFHMGTYDIAGMSEYSYNDARKKYPLVTLLQTSDLESTFVTER